MIVNYYRFQYRCLEDIKLLTVEDKKSSSDNYMNVQNSLQEIEYVTIMKCDSNGIENYWQRYWNDLWVLRSLWIRTRRRRFWIYTSIWWQNMRRKSTKYMLNREWNCVVYKRNWNREGRGKRGERKWREKERDRRRKGGSESNRGIPKEKFIQEREWWNRYSKGG